MKKLNIIGCGRLGKTLAHLFKQHNVFEIQDVLNSSLESSEQTVDFLGSGNAIESLEDMQVADLYMIATPDGSIEGLCKDLSQNHLLNKDSLVFHCSGSLPSLVLQSAKDTGALTASIHPVKSFAKPEESVKTFAGTLCGFEGDEKAKRILQEAFEQIGGELFELKPEFKTEYHTASVFAANYLVTLIDASLQCYAKAGIPQEQAMKLIKSFAKDVFANLEQLSTQKALTGPIARGDKDLVVKQSEALSNWNGDLKEFYDALAKQTSKMIS